MWDWIWDLRIWYEIGFDILGFEYEIEFEISGFDYEIGFEIFGFDMRLDWYEISWYEIGFEVLGFADKRLRLAMIGTFWGGEGG